MSFSPWTSSRRHSAASLPHQLDQADLAEEDEQAQLPSELFQCGYHPGDGPASGLPCDDGIDLDPVFSFETDHLALRSNPDYRLLLSTLARLEAQRAKAVHDAEELLAARDEALRNPLQLVNKLQRGEGLGLPGRQVLAEMPDIDWGKYDVAVEANAKKKVETRNSADCNTPVDTANRVERTSRGDLLVRGRLFDEKKPVTFNQPWTAEEQRRLEELLLQFPSEDVEMERWKKIAMALGNRTAVQVQSRTQKYFQKLQKAGMPIPGRLGKNRYRYMRSGKNGNTAVPCKKTSGSLVSQKNSTFFPSMAPSVKMEEDDDMDDDALDGDHANLFSYAHAQQADSSSLGGILNDRYVLDEEDVSDEEDVPASLRATPAYTELMWLKRVRREKELEQRSGAPVVHNGFRCDGCDAEPIVGGRFQCTQCAGADTVDFCLGCAPKGLEVGDHHKREHVLRPVRRKEVKSLVDQGYSSSKNYLDLNFMK